MTADITLLHPDILMLYQRLITDLEAKGYVCHAIATYRPPAEENALPSSVTSVKASTSKHCTMLDGKPAAKAFDLGFFEDDGGYVSDGTDSRYQEAGKLWQQYGSDLPQLGLVWGGMWKVPFDPDHFQIT